MNVEAISLSHRLAFMSDGRTFPITNLIDAWGDETDDEDAAISFVCGIDREWLSAPLSDYEEATFH